MTTRLASRVYTVAALVAWLVLLAAPARAQIAPAGTQPPRHISDPATGERYHIEAAAGFWFPAAEMSISSQSLGIQGSTIDFRKDLGLTDQHFPELHLVLRPATKHKFRFQYIPIKYDQTAKLTRDIVFNGQKYHIDAPVTSTLDWKAYRIGYEYDFVTADRGFGGFVLDFKYTDVTARLASLAVTEFARARAPIPAMGGIFRVYPVPNISFTGEITGFSIDWLPKSITKNNAGHYFDVDFYGTLNFTNNVGVQVGYRSFDVGYVVNTDTGSFTVKGAYLGLVARY